MKAPLLDGSLVPDPAEFLAGAIESAPDAMVIADREGKIVLVNAQTERLFGHPRAELLGKGIEILVPGRFRERHAGHFTGFFSAPRNRAMGTAQA